MRRRLRRTASASERAAEEQARRIERVLADGRWRGGGGRRRWFYVARDGEVQFLELDDAAAGMLRDGEAGIVEDPVSPLGHSVLAGQRGLVTLVGIDPEHVRFWNRAQAPERRPE